MSRDFGCQTKDVRSGGFGLSIEVCFFIPQGVNLTVFGRHNQ